MPSPNYTDPTVTVRREHCAGTEAGGGATTEYAKFRSFQKMRLKKVHAAVTVAGTNAGHGFDVYSGTTSVGTIALGTSAANATASSALLDLTVTSLAQVSVKSLADATGKAQVVYEFEVMADSVQS